MSTSTLKQQQSKINKQILQKAKRVEKRLLRRERKLEDSTTAKALAAAVQSNKAVAKAVTNLASQQDNMLGRPIVNPISPPDVFKRRKEFIGTLSGSVAFTMRQALYINPGNTAMFPRFSTIASTYTEYRIRYLRFFTITKSYTGNATGASAGSIVMATNCNPQLADFASYEEMDQYEGATVGVTYNNITHYPPLEDMAMRKGHDRRRTYQVLVGDNFGVPAGVASSVDDYHVGKFQIATIGQSVTTNIADLWVEYEFELLTPRLPIYQSPGPIALLASTTTATTSDLLNGLEVNSDSSSQLSVGVGGGGTLTVYSTPALANYMLSVNIAVASANNTTTTLTLTPSGDTTEASFLVSYGGTPTAYLPSSTTGYTSAATGLYYSSTGTWNFTLGGTVTGVTSTNLIVCVMPAGFNASTATVTDRLRLKIDEQARTLSRLQAVVERSLGCVDHDGDPVIVDTPTPTPTGGPVPVNRRY